MSVNFVRKNFFAISSKPETVMLDLDSISAAALRKQIYSIAPRNGDFVEIGLTIVGRYLGIKFPHYRRTRRRICIEIFS